jgi:hypothetical protein
VEDIIAPFNNLGSELNISMRMQIASLLGEDSSAGGASYSREIIERRPGILQHFPDALEGPERGQRALTDDHVDTDRIVALVVDKETWAAV